MKLPIYLDYSATTPVDPRVAQKMSECLLVDGNFGNPASRSHVFGWKAEESVENARRLFKFWQVRAADAPSAPLTAGPTPTVEQDESTLSKEARLDAITRGDGGQNLIGDEKGPLLGVIRTQELLSLQKRVDQLANDDELFFQSIHQAAPDLPSNARPRPAWRQVRLGGPNRLV